MLEKACVHTRTGQRCSASQCGVAADQWLSLSFLPTRNGLFLCWCRGNCSSWTRFTTEVRGTLRLLHWQHGYHGKQRILPLRLAGFTCIQHDEFPV